MTEEERSAIDLTLEATNGDRNAAAEILRVTPRQLKDKIHSSPKLKQRWANERNAAVAPTPVQTLSRPALPAPTADEQLASAIAVEDLKLRKGLKALKLTDSEIDLSVSLQGFHHKQYSEAAELVSGGVVMMAIKILSQIAALQQRLNNGFSGPNALMEETMVRDSLHRFIDQYTKIKDKVDEGAYKKALIELRKKEVNNPKRGRPGFEPLRPVTAVQINVQRQSEVTLHEKKEISQA